MSEEREEAKEKKRNFRYNEIHNSILAAIANLMDVDERTYKSRVSTSPEGTPEGEDLGEEGNEFKGFSRSSFSSDYEEESYKKKKFRVFPTIKAISKESGHSEAIVKTHMDDLKFENFRGTFQSLTPGILMSFASGIVANPKGADVKLWMQVVEGWEESSKVDNEHSGTLEMKVSRKIISVKKDDKPT